MTELAETFKLTTPEDRHQLPREEFVDRSEELLKESSIFIAESSYPSSGVEVEAEWANEHKVPIVLFVKTGKDYPETLKDLYLRVIKYDDPDDLKVKVNNLLNEEFPEESKQEYFHYSDKKQYKGYKKGWERKYK